MSSDGLGFEEFMRKLVNAPIPEKKPRRSRSSKHRTDVKEKKNLTRKP
jgi:hypothetical protein